MQLVREDLVDVTPQDHTECGYGESWPQTNSLLMWAKSIAPHAEEGAVGAAALVPGVNHDLRAAERGHGRIWCRFPFEKREKQIQVNMLVTGRFRARLDRNGASGGDLVFENRTGKSGGKRSFGP